MDTDDNPLFQRLMAQPRSPNIGEVFLRMPTDIAPLASSPTVYIVHEVRSAYGRTSRRTLGVFESKREAERKADAAWDVLISFVERYKGSPIDEEEHDGTLIQYWVTGNPPTILGFAVYVEKAVYHRYHGG